MEGRVAPVFLPGLYPGRMYSLSLSPMAVFPPFEYRFLLPCALFMRIMYFIMHVSTSFFYRAWALSALLITGMCADAYASAIPRSISSSVVKIYVTTQRPDYTLPWQGVSPTSGTGSGFVIGKKRILTNAHVVSDIRSLQVQKEGDPKRYRASVAFSGHDCDLAVLKVENDAFFEGTKPLKFAKEIPQLSDEVTVLGYPMGGSRISVTRGVVSRIDYSIYSHSGVDQHLVLQVDAAINPGNSGGPILFNNRVVGLAFQGLAWAENIGYAIPLPVLQHFLEDVEDGHYHGYPELGAAFMYTRNPALRADLGLAEDKTGVALTYVDPFGSGANIINTGDVILKVDGHDIANDGTVALNGNRVVFAELLERKQWGDAIELEVWRDGKAIDLKVPLKNPHDPFIFRSIYDETPKYLVRGGLVFCPLTREYLRKLGGAGRGENTQQLTYVSEYAKVDGLHKDFDEFVVFIRRLAHPVNAYTDEFKNGIVVEANGRKIRNLGDLREAWKQPKDGFHFIRFSGMDDVLILSAKEAKASEREIMSRYGVPAREYLGGNN